ncbi:MAG TPA: SGNH/GDSL hydrolase family protein [Pseudonocardiaceae bacterium]|jgi:lysophospholipase L1-like esterase|nr:SGNH/GDSL hydrolase family protein [Pseudonocardiaceae bacterium]
MAHHRRLLAGYAAVIAFAGMLAGTTQAAGATQAAPAFQHYVALGDSYASGPFIPNQSPDPVGCARSDHDYAGDLARSMGIPTLVDVSCGGAESVDMTQAQSVPLGSNPPQFNALTANTDLVTVTIGGNDIGFTSIIETCALDSLTNPFGNPCQQHYTSGGTDQLAATINADAPKIAAVLSGIRQRAPHAKVVVVDYLRILPTSIGCWPVVPVSIGDVPWLGGVEQELDAMLGAQANAAGDTFVDAGLPTGHDTCEPEGTKWVEGIVPTAPAFPVHPNAAGMSAVAGMIRTALG